MKTNINPFLVNLPTIDLHGETLDVAIYLLNDFIEDNLKLEKPKIVVIHGLGDILRFELRNHLKEHKLVKTLEFDLRNDGVTIINLKTLK